jgi:hypothetical protein
MATPGHDGLDNPKSDPRDDAFDRWPFSKRMADTIAAFDTLDGAAVFGVFGRWGYGKSTVLNYIKHELSTTHREKVVLFEFNPWLFTSQEELLAAFFAGLAARLEMSVKSRTKSAAKVLEKYSGVFGLLPVVGSAAERLAGQIGKEMSADSLANQRERVVEIMRGAVRSVVVLIDDLDRLDPEEILTMLKVIRLNANVPRVIYVLAFDDEMIARAVSPRYRGGLDSGRQFLEKIVQYPFALPAVGRERLTAFLVSRAKKAVSSAGLSLDDETWSRVSELVDTAFSRRLNTPRQAIRFVNAVEFALPMLKGEANPYEQIVLEGLRVLFPELYTLLRDDVRSFTSLDYTKTIRWIDRDKFSRYSESALRGSSSDEKDAGEQLVGELFVDPSRPKSIARPAYFDRYFMYTVPESLENEQQIAQTVMGAQSDAGLAQSLAAMFGAHLEPFLRAVYLLPLIFDGSRVERFELPAEKLIVLARALARCAHLFVSNPPALLDKFAADSSSSYGGEGNPLVTQYLDLADVLVASIQESIEAEEARDEVYASMVELANPAALAIRLCANMLTNTHERHTNKLKRARSAGARRIGELANANPSAVLKDYAESEPGLTVEWRIVRLWNQWDARGQQDWLNEYLRKNPKIATKILSFSSWAGRYEDAGVERFASRQILRDVLLSLDPKIVQYDHLASAFLRETSPKDAGGGDGAGGG